LASGDVHDLEERGFGLDIENGSHQVISTVTGKFNASGREVLNLSGEDL